MKDKKYCKIRDHCYYTGKYRDAAYKGDLKYNVPKKNSGAFHDRSNYDYHFIIKKFAAKFGK